MTPQSHEQTINTALGEVLRNLGRGWSVRSENIGSIFEEGGRPDVLVEKPAGWPIVVEAEVGDHREAERDAMARLGNRLVTTSGTIDTSVALVYADDLRSYSGEALRDAIRDATLEYALYSRDADGYALRLPSSGWLSGGVAELALLLHRSGVPAWRVESLADSFELGVTRAAGDFSASHPTGSALGNSVADVLGQSDDEAGQTRRMAMTVVVNALVFHAALAEAEMLVSDDGDDDERPVEPPREFRSQGNFLPTRLVDEWARILEVDYWPIFHTAGAILRELPTQTAVSVLNVLWETAEELLAGGVTRSHDLTGIVFQRLIADRKFLATYYTRPAGAALLAGLAMPLERPLAGTNWADRDALESVRIGDFACGTGTLLSTAYQRMGRLHEVHQGDPESLHPEMMRHGLVGLDVLNLAVHLTAAMLAGSYPDTPFEGECLLTMPYGEYDWGVSVGSLELLEEQPSFEIMQAAAYTAGGRGSEEVRDLLDRVGHRQFQLVIMNPPFTRHGSREGDRSDVHNPAFAAFEADEELQDRLSAHTRHLARDGCAHGHAGLASYFVELAHRKTAESGTMALVLPMSSMSGGSWEKARSLWREKYSSILVTTITEKGSHSRSFSADTGMAECLVRATKSPQEDNPRATFAMLDDQPQSVLQGELIAQAITTAVDGGNVRKLEDGPFGGTRVSLGGSFVAEIVNCPLPREGAWQLVGISDVTLGQTAHQLTEGRIWIEGMSEESAAGVPVAEIGEVCARIGPHHLDIAGGGIKSDGLPQGPFEKIDGTPPDGAAYPSLWNHDASRERELTVLPDSRLQLREVSGEVPEALRERAQERWETASRAHYNHDLRFNSQSLTVAMTDRLAIGGRAWPSVVFDDTDREFAFALWCNSTLGLLCHWWMANKTQSGRGSTTITTIPLLTTLDLRALSDDQLDAARSVFDDLQGKRFLPFNQIDEDAARAELDRRLLTEVLRLDASLCQSGGPMERLRSKLAAEPQIHGGKQSRLVFTEDGEELVPLGEDE